MTDEELKALVASLAIAQQKTDEQMKQTDEQMKRTDEQIASLLADQKEIKERMRQTDEQMRQTDEQMKSTDKKLDKIAELVGNIGKNQGDIAEEYFFNSLSHDARLGTIHFEDIAQNMHKQRGKLEEEYDLVMTNGDTIGIIEVKYKVHVNDLNKLERKMRNFKMLFPVYATYKVYGAIATFHIHSDAKDAALERGFFVLQRSGKVIHTDCGPNLLVM